MKNILSILILGALLMLFTTSCDDKLPPIDTLKPNCIAEIDGPLKLIWSSLIRPDSSQETSIPVQIFENDLLVNNNYPGDLNTIYSFNPQTGERQWTWDNYPEVGDRIYRVRPNQRVDNSFYFSYSGYKILLDLDTHKERWISDELYSKNQTIAIGDYLYMVAQNKVKTQSEFRRVHKDAQQPDWESLFFIQDGHRCHPPSLWMNPAGDSVLVFTSIQFNPKRTNFFAYNLSSRALDWSLLDSGLKESTSHEMVVIGDRAVFTMHHGGGIAALNLLTGQIAWQHPIANEYFAQCRPLEAEGMFIVTSDQSYLYFMNPENGLLKRKIFWGEGNSGNGSLAGISYYDGAIYFAGDVDWKGYLMGMDLTTFEMFLKTQAVQKECFPTGIFNGEPSIDPKTGRLYMNDGILLYCFQIEPR